MLSIEPIEITKTELKRLLFAAILLPPVCTLAGALVVASSIRSVEWAERQDPVVAMATGSGDIDRLPHHIPTLELVTPTDDLNALFTLLPRAPFAVPLPAETELALLPAADAELVVQAAAVEQKAEQQETEIAQQVSGAEPASAAPQEQLASTAEAGVTLEPVSFEASSAHEPPAAGPFVVQAGVFAREANARLYRERLLRRGVSSSVIEHTAARGPVWHVVLGRYESWRAAERARKQLAADLNIELIAIRLPLRSVAQQVATI